MTREPEKLIQCPVSFDDFFRVSASHGFEFKAEDVHAFEPITARESKRSRRQNPFLV